jgi:glutathione S-transferase
VAFVGLITLLMLLQYILFMMLVGKQRAAHGINAPAVTGHEMFERAYRVQMNTLEQMVVAMAAMWVCGWFFLPPVAGVLGAIFIIGRFVYWRSYMSDPKKRGTGMVIGFLANMAMIGCGFWGVLTQL